MARSRPIGTPTCGQLALRPRRRSSPDSSVIRTAPPHSPPRPSPWTKRSATSSDRRPHPDRRVGRHQADRERREAHQQQGDDQDVLAAELVAVVAEDDAAEGAGDEAHGVGREGQQGAHQRLEAGEEELVEDQRGGGAVDEEVVPLQRRPDQARDDDAAHRRRWRGGRCWASCSLDIRSPWWRPTAPSPGTVLIVQQWDKRQDQQDQVRCYRLRRRSVGRRAHGEEHG